MRTSRLIVCEPYCDGRGYASTVYGADTHAWLRAHRHRVDELVGSYFRKPRSFWAVLDGDIVRAIQSTASSAERYMRDDLVMVAVIAP